MPHSSHFCCCSVFKSCPLSWGCHPTMREDGLSPLLLPSIFPSIRIFSNESALHIRWPKYWSFSFSTSPSSEYSGLISFRIDWFDLLVVQVTLKGLLQHHSSKASILQMIQFRSHKVNSSMTPPSYWVEKLRSVLDLSIKSLFFSSLFHYAVLSAEI